MKRIGVMAVAAVAMAMFVGSPSSAAHKKTSKTTVSCKQIKDAIAAGKSEEDVQKDLKVSATRVKNCTAPTAHPGKHRAAKKT